MIILDLETSGINYKRDKIIEIGALKIGKHLRIDDVFETRVNPHISLPSYIQTLTRLTDVELAEAPDFNEIADELFIFLNGNRCIGYNVSFDKRFLVKADNRFSCLIYQDFLKYFKSLKYEVENYKLKTIARRFGISCSNHHTALGDARILLELIKRFGYPS